MGQFTQSVQLSRGSRGDWRRGSGQVAEGTVQIRPSTASGTPAPTSTVTRRVRVRPGVCAFFREATSPLLGWGAAGVYGRMHHGWRSRGAARALKRDHFRVANQRESTAAEAVFTSVAWVFCVHVDDFSTSGLPNHPQRTRWMGPLREGESIVRNTRPETTPGEIEMTILV